MPFRWASSKAAALRLATVRLPPPRRATRAMTTPATTARRIARATVDQPESVRACRTAGAKTGKEFRARKSISVSSNDKKESLDTHLRRAEKSRVEEEN
jgi:hypothetical protein